jgi:hypothetical protein
MCIQPRSTSQVPKVPFSGVKAAGTWPGRLSAVRLNLHFDMLAHLYKLRVPVGALRQLSECHLGSGNLGARHLRRRSWPGRYLSGHYSNAVTALCLVNPDTRTGTALEKRRIGRVAPSLLISQFTIGKTPRLNWYKSRMLQSSSWESRMLQSSNWYNSRLQEVGCNHNGPPCFGARTGDPSQRESTGLGSLESPLTPAGDSE